MHAVDEHFVFYKTWTRTLEGNSSGQRLNGWCSTANGGQDMLHLSACMQHEQNQDGLTVWAVVLGALLGWFCPTLCASLIAAICCSAAWVWSWRRWAWPACSPRALSNTLTALSFSFISSICIQTGRQTGGETDGLVGTVWRLDRYRKVSLILHVGVGCGG